MIDPKQRWTLLRGDCYDVLKTIPDNSIDAVVTDPPYGLSDDVDIRKVIRHWFMNMSYKHDKSGFMGADWDSFVPGPEIWREVYRVMKPGAHLLAFTGSRTMDLMGFSIRFAGFEMRDTVMAWVYGTGKPKTLDIAKGIDAYAGAERQVVAKQTRTQGGYHIRTGLDESVEWDVTVATTPEAKYWDGWHTGLKPGFEPVLVARKPLADGMTVVENVLTHGTGGLNIGECRVGEDVRYNPPAGTDSDIFSFDADNQHPGTTVKGRWPMNVLLTHHPACEEGGKCHPECSTVQVNAQVPNTAGFFPQFYYNGKALKDDRYAYVECGCAEARVMPLVDADALVFGSAAPTPRNVDGKDQSWRQFDSMADAKAGALCENCGKPMSYERHPTVKPTSVMRWLVRLVVPKGGLVLDPFNGSGSTGVAALVERRRYVGIEREHKFYAIASKRLEDTAAASLPYEEPPPLRGIDVLGVPDEPSAIPLPSSEELRRAFDITEEVKVEKPVAATLKAADFKKLVAKGLKRTK